MNSDDLPSAPTFIDHVLRIAEMHPDRLCARLIHPGREDELLDYRTLVAGARRYARAYQQAGIQPHDVLIVVLRHGTEVFHAFVGAMIAGVVPSMFAFPSAKVPKLVYQKTMGSLLEITRPRGIVGEEDIIDDLEAAGVVPNQVILLRPRDAASALPTPIETPVLAEEDVALLQHSSGTTGLKKGVALSNRSIVNQLRSYAASIRLEPQQDRIASWLPLYHDMGLIACFLLPMATGVPVVMMSPFDWVANPVMLLQAISNHRCTLCWLPNFAYKFLADRTRDEDLLGVDLSSMRALINCAEPVSQASHDAFLERFGALGFSRHALCASYAMAENTFAVSQGGIDEPLAVEKLDLSVLRSQRRAVLAQSDEVPTQTVVSSGTILPNHDVRIVDPGRNKLPERQIGEIAIRSDCMLTEYYRRSDATAEAMAQGWYYTGDLGYMAGRHLFVTGRKKDMIIVAGKNIYPQDIEEIASSVPGIHPGRVVAFGVFNEEQGTEEVVLLAETDEQDVKVKLRIKLAIASAIRDELECVANEIHLLPPMWLLKSTSGKISRGANRERYFEEIVRKTP